MTVEIPLAIAGAWHELPVCSQIATGTTPMQKQLSTRFGEKNTWWHIPKQTAAPEPIEDPPDPPAPAANPPLRQEYTVPL